MSVKYCQISFSDVGGFSYEFYLFCDKLDNKPMNVSIAESISLVANVYNLLQGTLFKIFSRIFWLTNFLNLVFCSNNNIFLLIDSKMSNLCATYL